MAFSGTKAYLRIILGSLVLLAALVMLLTNLGNRATIHVYWETLAGVSLGWILLLSAASGVAVYFAVIHLVRGIRGLVRRRHARQAAAAVEASDT